MHATILQILGKPAEPWPPDHYALLGLTPQSASPAEVESAVQVRMDRLRQFQLTHPDDVTEAMNRLAQALITLSDPATKAAYDEAFRSEPSLVANESVRPSAEKSSFSTSPPVVEPTAEGALPGGTPAIDEGALVQPLTTHAPTAPAATSFAWRQPGDPDFYEVIPLLPDGTPAPAAVVPGPPPLPVRPPSEHERRLPSEWTVAQNVTPPTEHKLPPRSDVTRARIHALKQARNTLEDWDRVGAYLTSPSRTLSSRAEAAAVVASLRRIGEDPQSTHIGYGAEILELAHSRPTVTSLAELTAARREELAESWRRGRHVLRGEYLGTRQSVGRHRRRHHLRRAVLRLRRWLPEAILLLAGSLALIIAVVRQANG